MFMKHMSLVYGIIIIVYMTLTHDVKLGLTLSQDMKVAVYQVVV